jgi:hypothetical protein
MKSLTGESFASLDYADQRCIHALSVNDTAILNIGKHTIRCRCEVSLLVIMDRTGYLWHLTESLLAGRA